MNHGITGRVALAVMVAVGCFQATIEEPKAEPAVTMKAQLTDVPAVMFQWSRDRCAPNDTPDSQARAFRDAHGTMHLFSVSEVAFAFVGPDLDHLRHECRPVFRSLLSPDSSRFADYSWLASTYTEDGVTIQALFHNELHGWDRPTLCTSRQARKCSYVSITEGISRDGGKTFSLDDRGTVLTPPDRYRPDSGFAGYMNPSNIIRLGEYYYFAVGAMGYGPQLGGICLLRTKTLSDPRSWRAWDGHDFSARSVDPYREEVVDPAKHVCRPVDEALAGLQAVSILRHEPNELFIMVGLKGAGGRHGRRKFLAPYVSTSQDLIHWSVPTPLLTTVDEERLGSTWYPTLIDPGSTDRNFSTVGNSAELIFVRFNNPKDSRDRDMLRVPVKLNVGSPVGAVTDEGPRNRQGQR